MTRKVDCEFSIDTDTGEVCFLNHPIPLFILPTPIDPHIGYVALKDQVTAKMAEVCEILQLAKHLAQDAGEPA